MQNFGLIFVNLYQYTRICTRAGYNKNVRKFAKLLIITALLTAFLPAEARRTRHSVDTIYTNRPDTLQLDTTRKYGISVRDNIFWNIAGTPNLGVEVPLE